MNQRRCWPNESTAGSSRPRRGIAAGEGPGTAARRRSRRISSSSRCCLPVSEGAGSERSAMGGLLLASHQALEADQLHLHLVLRQAGHPLDQLARRLAVLLLAPAGDLL